MAKGSYGGIGASGVAVLALLLALASVYVNWSNAQEIQANNAKIESLARQLQDLQPTENNDLKEFVAYDEGILVEYAACFDYAVKNAFYCSEYNGSDCYGNYYNESDRCSQVLSGLSLRQTKASAGS